MTVYLNPILIVVIFVSKFAFIWLLQHKCERCSYLWKKSESYFAVGRSLIITDTPELSLQGFFIVIDSVRNKDF